MFGKQLNKARVERGECSGSLARNEDHVMDYLNMEAGIQTYNVFG
jgi:hypothetical protein